MSKTSRRIFLSYHVDDKEPVRRIADCLRESGFPVWDPEREILPGAEWTSTLKKALDSALAVVVFVSPEALKSSSVSREIEYALGARHLRGRLIPVILRPAKNAPWILQSLQPIRYEDPSQTSARIVELLSQPFNASQAKRSA